MAMELLNVEVARAGSLEVGYGVLDGGGVGADSLAGGWTAMELLNVEVAGKGSLEVG